MRVLVVGALALGALSAVPAAAQAGPAWCADGARVSVSNLPAGFAAGTCEAAVTVVNGAASVRLPARGTAVTASVLTTRGEDMLTVARAASGAVTVGRDGVPSGSDTAQSACSSSGYQVLGYHVAGGYRWSYTGRGAPANVAGSAAGVIRTATTNITSGRDDCGIAGRPATSHRYLGTTGTAPGITSSASCGSNDGKSVTGWKSLSAPGVLAVTCTYYNTGTHAVAASDAAINTRYRWAVSRSGCSNAYDLEGVMTHERGHTFGLGHSTADPGLTMYPSVRACDFSKATLGRGDLLGLFKIYGKA